MREWFNENQDDYDYNDFDSNDIEEPAYTVRINYTTAIDYYFNNIKDAEEFAKNNLRKVIKEKEHIVTNIGSRFKYDDFCATIYDGLASDDNGYFVIDKYYKDDVM